MEEYKGEKIEVEPYPFNKDKNNLKTYQLKGKDNQFYNLQIYQKEKTIIINAKIVDDFIGMIYSKSFTIEDLYNLNNFFRQYLSIEELLNFFFKNLKEKEITVVKNFDTIKISFLVLSRNKKEEVNLLLNEEKLEMKNIVHKLCEKIKDMEKMYKEKKEQKRKKENSKTFITKLMESKMLSLFNFVFFFMINLAIIIYINKKEKEFNHLKSEIVEMKLFGKSLKFVVKEVNRKFNKIIDKNSKDINNEIHAIKKNISNNINDVKNDINEIKEKNNIISENKTEIIKKESIIDADLEKNPIEYYINKFNAFNLIKEGIKKKKEATIKKYNLIFRASRDGFKADDFHKKFDGKKNTVTFILTTKRNIFGGFTDVSWDSESDAKEGSNGFIFSLNRWEIYYNIIVNFNIRCLKEYGPIFGNFDLSINDNCNKNMSFISPYAYDLHGKNSFLEENRYFYVKDYEIYELELESKYYNN